MTINFFTRYLFSAPLSKVHWTFFMSIQNIELSRIIRSLLYRTHLNIDDLQISWGKFGEG